MLFRQFVDLLKSLLEHLPYTLIAVFLLIALILWVIENKGKIGGAVGKVGKPTFWIYLALTMAAILFLCHIYVATVEMINEEKGKTAASSVAPVTIGAPADGSFANPYKMAKEGSKTFSFSGDEGSVYWVELPFKMNYTLWVNEACKIVTSDGKCYALNKSGGHIPELKKFGIQFFESGSLTISTTR